MSDRPALQDNSTRSPTGLPVPPVGVATLARDLADFLVEFSIVLHKRAMYPPGHPHLQESAERFVDRLEALLERREGLVIGVARHQLIIGGVATDPRNALLSDLARRLHRERIASVRFQRGLTLHEIDELLGSLSGEAGEGAGPLGLRLERAASWRHVQIQAPELGRLLLDPGGHEPADEPAAGSPEDLWLGLANLALSADGGATPDGEDPLIVARAIDDQVGQFAYDRVVLDYLGQMAEEISGRAGAWEPRARERVSRLVAGLHPDTLRSLLEAGADHAERRRFALTASEVLAVDAVVEVVEAAAVTTGQSISSHLLRLLHKFAHHAERTTGPARVEAESVLRKNVAQLIANWELDDPNPAEYTAVLEGLVRQVPSERAVVETESSSCDAESRSCDAESSSCDPEIVLQIALETGALGPRVYAAVDRLVEERRFGRVAALLADAPAQQTADALWRHVATPARLRGELAASPVDFTAVEGLAVRLGVAAADPLLDRLESATDQTSRARVLKALIRLGHPAAAPAAARLGQAPWYVQRNILVLLRTQRAWPPGFSPISYARHPHPRVRREAYKLLIEHPVYRASALSHGLSDPDAGIVRLALHAALESCLPETARAVERFLNEGRRTAELRALAVRVLAQATGAQALPRLVGLAGDHRVLRGWRLAPKSPIVLAALGGLAKYWGGHPEAAGLLALAREHPDPDFRLAARAEFA
jgi:hypothetical protein